MLVLFIPLLQPQAECRAFTLSSLGPHMEASASHTEADNALLEQVALGDHVAFGRFYDRVSGPLYSMALRMLNHNEQDAREALQEGLEEIWRKAPAFDSTRSSAFTWAVMIFRSRLVDRVRRSASRGRMMEKLVNREDAEASDEHTALQSLARQEDCRIVRRVLSALKDEQQELLRHAFFSGWTQQEIAENTGRPLGTVKTIIRRALIELRERLSREGYEA